MTIAGAFQTSGLYIAVHKPLVRGGGYAFDLVDSVVSYNHEIDAVGGYWTAGIQITATVEEATDWYEHGLGRQILVYNPNANIVWRGFVNQIAINMGVQSETLGPLMDTGNRASVTYTPKDFSVYPPVTGTGTVTPIAENLTSQAKYGIVEKVVSGGTCTDLAATKIRDVYLLENAYPKTSGGISLSPGAGENISITLDCLGNAWWLTAYVYDNVTPGYIYVSDKIKDIIGFDPNNYLSTKYNNIADNLFLTQEMETETRFAWDIIKELLALGNDTDDTRRLFGVYNDLLCFYYNMPNKIEYNHFLADPLQRVVDMAGNTVLPWDVRPGKWIAVPDFLPGLQTPATLRQDPRNKFIETVRFTAPYTIDLSGGNTDKLSQLVAKITFCGGMF